MQITFQPGNRIAPCRNGDSLLKIAEQSGILIDASCGGTGTCGKCKVQILSGNPGELTAAEAAVLSQGEIEKGYRLACEIRVSHDLSVAIPGSHGGSARKKNMTRLPENFLPPQRIYAVYGKVLRATMKDQKNHIQRIAACFNQIDMIVIPHLLPYIHPALDGEGGNVTAVFRGNMLLDLKAGDTSSACYGVAFDIGTTTVVGILWDMQTNTIMDVDAKTNYQSVYGSDVISRIQFCTEAPENLSLMQGKVIACCNDILSGFRQRNDISADCIYDASIVGNTTMSHLFLGVDCRSMSRTPYVPVFASAQTFTARDLQLQIHPNADVYLLPNISGHVGSDIVAMMLAVEMDSLSGCHIAIDIGTNGEVVAIKNGKMVCCSTAAGPAFEGASIRHGMRAAQGAIEGVRITADSVECKTIEDMPPLGLCGSGLIDAVAQLLDSCIVDPSGRMLESDEAVTQGIHPALAARILRRQSGLSFLLASVPDGDDIVLTQQDIREVQLAKGAVLAGILTLMKVLDMEIGEIDSIMLAGAFGNYIQKESALRIGLLPQVPLSKIISVGNAAGAGSSMALLSNEQRLHASQIALETTHIELSMNMDFQDFYMEAMSFHIY